jgi:cell wall-associated NlpC family hydrolase
MWPVFRVGVVLVSALLAAACATTGGVPRPFPGAPISGAGSVADPPAPSAPGASTGQTGAPGLELLVLSQPLIATALSYRGVPYRNGGSDPSGFDCSGFVQWVFAQQGHAHPRDVRDQYQRGEPVDRQDIRPGDLVFFETVSRGASHVGIALGEDQFVHAPSSNGVVRVERYTVDYWKKRYVGARRVE